ncbi:Quercetin 2,3-dioxygenase [Cytospora mali]|uniref:Quercetin 2,3-dioxygenase n=1 Tax=Cytospora mali TaxID=578113 RepID=A0A194VBR3_CYTMA|nr:Quercetin 2,3-dioxygenase [Valsa mali var. pyri (nom. inval.)]
MADYKVVKVLPMGNKLCMRLLLYSSEPETSLKRWTNEIVCDGGPDSDPLWIPLHWHKYHTEHITLIEGRVEITVGSKTHIVGPGEELQCPAGVVHAMKGFKGERMVLRESADPPGEYKSLFFNDLISSGYMESFWQTMRSFYDGDTYPVLPLYFRFFDVAFVTVFGGISKLILPAKPHFKLE